MLYIGKFLDRMKYSEEGVCFAACTDTNYGKPAEWVFLLEIIW